MKVICSQHGARIVESIGLLGPTLTRPELQVVERTDWDGVLWSADPNCDHYVYAAWSGVKCIRCPGWYCA